jgi:hypothetical protein
MALANFFPLYLGIHIHHGAGNAIASAIPSSSLVRMGSLEIPGIPRMDLCILLSAT